MGKEKSLSHLSAWNIYRLLEFFAALLYPLLFLFCFAEELWMLSFLKNDWPKNWVFWCSIAVVPLGWALGDFVTGVVHWAFDTYGDEETPLLGKTFIAPFRRHHHFPQEICEHDLVETLGNSCLGAIPLLCGLLLLSYFAPFSIPIHLFNLSMIWMSLAAVLANQFHKWAHAEFVTLPRWVKYLQKRKIILSAPHHQIHHTPPHRSYYSITSGWSDAFLERVKFFSLCERIIKKLFFV